MLNSYLSFADLQSTELVPYLLHYSSVCFYFCMGVGGGLSINDASLYTYEFLYIHCFNNMGFFLVFCFFPDAQIVVSLAIRSLVCGILCTLVRALLLCILAQAVSDAFCVFPSPDLEPRNVSFF